MFTLSHRKIYLTVHFGCLSGPCFFYRYILGGKFMFSTTFGTIRVIQSKIPLYFVPILSDRDFLLTHFVGWFPFSFCLSVHFGSYIANLSRSSTYLVLDNSVLRTYWGIILFYRYVLGHIKGIASCLLPVFRYILGKFWHLFSYLLCIIGTFRVKFRSLSRIFSGLSVHFRWMNTRFGQNHIFSGTFWVSAGTRFVWFRKIPQFVPVCSRFFPWIFLFGTFWVEMERYLPCFSIYPVHFGWIIPF